jgi:7,8-dihydropterin-6-yl-methyl-4-(beta-D-ribofuranosyl)aminobenzene 5'-phosphate synthase
MMSAPLALSPVDTVQVTLIMDNAIDLLMAGADVVRRFPLGPSPFERPLPVAEHGFSALIRVGAGEKSGTVLFDTGASRRNLLYNMDALEVRAADLQAVVLSHGHADHAMGLPGLVERLGPRGVPLILHPDAYLERRLARRNRVGAPTPKDIGPAARARRDRRGDRPLHADRRHDPRLRRGCTHGSF